MPPGLRLAALAVAVAAVAGTVLVFAPHSPSELSALLERAGAAAPLVLLGAWVVLTPAMFPGTVLAGAAGCCWARGPAPRSRSPAPCSAR